MSENAMRESLLRQNATASVEAELKMLHGLMDAENRRARRLTTWTWVVWCVWFGVVVLMFVVYPLLGRKKPAAAQQPAVPAAQAAPRDEVPFIGVVILATVPLMLIAAVLLPPAGIILLILQILARRSATLSQLRVSVAAIDAQLKLLAAAQTSPPTDSEKGPD